MSSRSRSLSALGLLAVLLSADAGAVLVDRGGGLVYDSDLDITWLADFKYARTSGFDADGLMTWHTAMSWAANLVYSDPVRGTTWTDWRLPSALNPDGSGPCFGTGCATSELGHLLLVDGVAPNYPGPFTNLTNGSYWSNTRRAPLPGIAWLFHFTANGLGKQDFTGPLEDLLIAYAAAVRDGDVAAEVCVGVDCSSAGTACATASCDPNGVPGNCDLLTPLAAGTECRASLGACDLPEHCDGSSPVCPEDAANLTAECRPAAGVCDAAEFCSDASDDCPPNAFAPAATPCEDGLICTEGDSCDGAGVCSPGLANDGLCADALFCNGAETCDPSAGCRAGTPPLADDGIACTNEVCDEALDTVISIPDDASCDDGDPCTADTCDALSGCGHAVVPSCGAIDAPAASATGRILLAILLVTWALVLPRSKAV